MPGRAGRKWRTAQEKVTAQLANPGRHAPQLLQLPPELRVNILCHLRARSIPSLRLVCSELRNLIDSQQVTIAHHISQLHRIRLRSVVDAIDSFSWPTLQDEDVLEHFLEGICFWVQARGVSDRNTLSRQSAQTWMTHLNERAMAKFAVPSQSLTGDFTDCVFLAHEAMWLLYHHRCQPIANAPAGSLDTAEQFASYVEAVLGHRFTPFDLRELFHKVVGVCGRSIDFVAFRTRAGGREHLPPFPLTPFYYTRHSQRAGGQPLVIRGVSMMDTITSVLGVPRLDATAPIFGYYLNLDFAKNYWALTLIEKLDTGEEVAPLQKAVLLEYLRIY